MFLRVLEFYTGVLFLTTNRVGVLDDAIKSRITWSAYYPLLDKQQTKKIWKANIKLLEVRNKRLQVDTKGIMKFAKEHFISCTDSSATWNGRQIQNAFKVATALAEWEAYTQDVQHNIDTRVPEEDMPNQPKLTASHFRTIAAGTQAFDSYLREATGFTDAERAFHSMERADDYSDGNNAYEHGVSNNSPTLLSPSHDPYHRKRPSFSSSPGPFPSPRRPSSSSKNITTSPLQSSYARDIASGGTALKPLPAATENRRRKSTSSSLFQNQNPASNPTPGNRSRANTDSRKLRRPSGLQALGGNPAALSKSANGGKRRTSRSPENISSDGDSDGGEGDTRNGPGARRSEQQQWWQQQLAEEKEDRDGPGGDLGDDTLSSSLSSTSPNVSREEEDEGEEW